MSDSRSTSPSISDPGPGLSSEERAERELLRMMSSPPPPSGPAEDDDEVNEFDLDRDIAAVSSVTTAASLRNDLVVARRKATQLKLHPYQREAIEEFSKGSPVLKQIMLFVQLCAVENLISTIKTAAPPFVSSAQLLENIKSIAVAVLLSSKLSVYKNNSIPVDHVMTILTSVPRSYVPDSLTSDSFALKVVRADVQEELTQTRSRVKRAIKESIAVLANESDSIFDLATTIVTHSQLTVTVPLCARIALLRKIYVESPGSTFWGTVDARLQLIRTTAGGEAWKVTKAFECILQADRNAYGKNTSYTLPDSTTDIFQTSVDDVILRSQ